MYVRIHHFWDLLRYPAAPVIDDRAEVNREECPRSPSHRWVSPRGSNSITVTKHQGCAQCFPFPKGLSHTGLQIRRALNQLKTAEYATSLIVIQWRWNRCYLLVNSNAVANRHKHILRITRQVTFLSTESSGTRADCCFFHWSWVWLLFKVALESADMSHSSWRAVRVTKSPREGWPPRVAGISRKDPASMWSGCAVHLNVWPCGGLEGRHPGKMMHCWTHWRKFWLVWRFFKY